MVKNNLINFLSVSFISCYPKEAQVEVPVEAPVIFFAKYFQKYSKIELMMYFYTKYQIKRKNF